MFDNKELELLPSRNMSYVSVSVLMVIVNVSQWSHNDKRSI